jgi:hypothetical protein
MNLTRQIVRGLRGVAFLGSLVLGVYLTKGLFVLVIYGSIVNMQGQEDFEPTVRIRELKKESVNFVLENVDLAYVFSTQRAPFQP